MNLCLTRRLFVYGAAGLGMIWSVVGWGSSVPGGYRLIAVEYGVPDTVLYAIALAESGVGVSEEGVRRPWPWTLNVAGRGHVFPSRVAAWEVLSQLVARGERSIDIGLMQVNWRFHQEKLGDTWQALDPYHNLRVAARILRDCFERRRDWWAGVGCYHAPGNKARAERYRMRVAGHWQRLASNR